jgi:putative peptide zinc metalloprotease protein
LIEIPNLGTRSLKYLGYLVQRHLFALDNAEPPTSSRGERRWFVIYGTSSFLYRIFIYAAIIQFIAGKFFIFGVLLALWAVFSMLVIPVLKAGQFLFASPKLGRKRARAAALSACILAAALAAVTLVPLPLSTVTEGVIWLPEDSIIRAQTGGFVEQVTAVSGCGITAGDEIARCSDPILTLKERVLESQLRGLEIEYDMKERINLIEAQIKADEIAEVSKKLEDIRLRLDNLTVKAGTEGILIIPRSEDLPGRFIKRGEIIGYIIEPHSATVRSTVLQASVDMVRRNTREVAVRMPDNISKTLRARLVREVPAATENLPSPALGSIGGGTITVDPRDDRGMKTIQRLFLFDIELPPGFSPANVGGRVYVRFDHGSEPLIGRWSRAVRNLFLRRFGV